MFALLDALLPWPVMGPASELPAGVPERWEVTRVRVSHEQPGFEREDAAERRNGRQPPLRAERLIVQLVLERSDDLGRQPRDVHDDRLMKAWW